MHVSAKVVWENEHESNSVYMALRCLLCKPRRYFHASSGNANYILQRFAVTWDDKRVWA